MDFPRVMTIIALTLLLAEGFALSVFPAQFKQMLIEANPRALQAIGLIETVVSVGLIAGILLT
ncbi:MAG TPA: hypothetical protein VGJ26_12400 [Pirellulales bacterium]|jgi:uncharacterized protein YjeT (DUF2065 family)